MNKITKFLGEVRTELMKVSWPSRNEAINLTLAVLGISIFFALYVGLIDIGLTEGIKYLTTKGYLKQQATTQSAQQTIPVGNVNAETSPVKK